MYDDDQPAELDGDELGIAVPEEDDDYDEGSGGEEGLDELAAGLELELGRDVGGDEEMQEADAGGGAGGGNAEDDQEQDQEDVENERERGASFRMLLSFLSPPPPPSIPLADNEISVVICVERVQEAIRREIEQLQRQMASEQDKLKRANNPVMQASGMNVFCWDVSDQNLHC
jgi:hypothetical protein